MQKQNMTQTIVHSHDEQILVVKREVLFNTDSWQGCRQVDFTSYMQTIQKHQEFLPRSVMETDEQYKQIIPYLVFTVHNKFFMVERRAQASEQRLASKLSLGIGGHIRVEDIYPSACAASLAQHGDPETEKNNSSSVIYDWARREFHEEVHYDGAITITPLGIINDDSNAVGRVHIGFALLVRGEHENIQIASELKEGRLVSLEECRASYNRLETWSQLLLPFLQ